MPPRAEDTAAYEGLVYKTASMFHARVGLEFEDFCQEVRIKIVKARRAYDPTRSRMSERNYVYACVANLVKDMKATAAVRHMRLTECHPTAPRSVTRDEVYGIVENGSLRWPDDLTDAERQIAVLLGLNYSQAEVARRLGMDYRLVGRAVASLRVKLADWRPSVAA